jgi:hypothetical protein
MKEIWRDIQGYEGYYQVSNYGRVKSLERYVCAGSGNRYRQEMLLKVSPRGSGYVGTILHEHSIKTNFSVHRLVAQAFISNPKNKPCINHKDGNKLNNNVSNLEWVTYKENTAHAWKFGLNKPVTKPVLMSNVNDEPLLVFDSLVEAKRQTGIDDSHISHCCNGKRKTTGGYKWSYV